MTAALKLHTFVERCPPIGPLKPATQDVLERYRPLLPASLLELWERHGFGRYARGLVEVINPQDYEAILWKWLMRDEDPSRLPIALTAFGGIFYYRRLTDEDEDVSYLDPHGPEYQAVVCAWSLDQFFNEYLPDPEVESNLLDADLVRASIATIGPLEGGECFQFTPALRLGGTRDVRFVTKGNGQVHLDLLHQLAVGG